MLNLIATIRWVVVVYLFFTKAFASKTRLNSTA
jgi:hypothetical protein